MLLLSLLIYITPVGLIMIRNTFYLCEETIYLFILFTEARSVILGPEYVKAGSTINLTCVINQVNMPGKVTTPPDLT